MVNEAVSGIDPTCNNNMFPPGQQDASVLDPPHGQLYGLPLTADANFRMNRPGADGDRYYTIQRVNGSGTADGTDGGHKHTLEESDRVKKNSVQRHFLKEEKVKRRFQVSSGYCFVTVARLHVSMWERCFKQRDPTSACRLCVISVIGSLAKHHDSICAKSEQSLFPSPAFSKNIAIITREHYHRYRICLTRRNLGRKRTTSEQPERP